MKPAALVALITSVIVLVVAAFAVGRASAPEAKAVAGGAPTTTSTTHDMAQMSTAEDRGFSLLGNGMEHDDGFTQGISPTDRVELARQLVLAREVALQYPTVRDAEAAGLRRAGPFSPGLGAHYLSVGNSGANPDGVMSDDDIRKPVAWIYDGTHPDSRIAGLFYMTPIADAAGFAGPNDTWHLHTGICIVTNAQGNIDTPLGADRGATREECDKVGGNLLDRTQYLLHVWVVPGFESPEGVFSHLSSAITCDDGTYKTIPDVTKVGTATTICLDGTE